MDLYVSTDTSKCIKSSAAAVLYAINRRDDGFWIAARSFHNLLTAISHAISRGASFYTFRSEEEKSLLGARTEHLKQLIQFSGRISIKWISEDIVYIYRPGGESEELIRWQYENESIDGLARVISKLNTLQSDRWLLDRIRRTKASGVDGKISIERLIRGSQLSWYSVENNFSHNHANPRAIFLEKLREDPYSYDLMGGLLVMHSVAHLPNISDQNNLKVNEDKNDAHSCIKYECAAHIGRWSGRSKLICSVGSNVRSILSNVDILNARVGEALGVADKDLPILKEVTQECLMNALIHGTKGGGEAEYMEGWEAPVSSIGRFTDRIEFANLSGTRQIDDVRMHWFMSDLGLAHGRKYGHFQIRYSMRKIGAGSPIIIGGDGRYRVILASAENFGRILLSKNPLRGYGAIRSDILKIFILKLLVAIRFVSPLEISKYFHAPYHDVIRHVSLFRKLGVVELRARGRHNRHPEILLLRRDLAEKTLRNLLKGFDAVAISDILEPRDLCALSYAACSASSEKDAANSADTIMSPERYGAEDIRAAQKNFMEHARRYRSVARRTWL